MGASLRCGWAACEATESLGSFSFSLFMLSRFYVGTDSLTDAVRLSLKTLNTKESVRLWKLPQPIQSLTEGVESVPLRLLKPLRRKLTPRHDPRAHSEDAPLRIKCLVTIVLLNALLEVVQPGIEASCECLRVGNPVLDIGKQTVAPGHGQCDESSDPDEQNGPNQFSTRWIVAPVSSIITTAPAASPSLTMWVLLYRRRIARVTNATS